MWHHWLNEESFKVCSFISTPKEKSGVSFSLMVFKLCVRERVRVSLIHEGTGKILTVVKRISLALGFLWDPCGIYFFFFFFHLVGIWCHEEINNSQSQGSTFPLRAVFREEQKCWQKPEGSWQGQMSSASASVLNPQ